jgi:hypothetical protein
VYEKLTLNTNMLFHNNKALMFIVFIIVLQRFRNVWMIESLSNKNENDFNLLKPSGYFMYHQV